MKMILKTGLLICCCCSLSAGFTQTVFSHTTTAQNVEGNYTVISMPSNEYQLTVLNYDHWALIIKPNPGQKAANPNPVGAWLDLGGKQAWCIYNENRVNMPVGVTFTYWLEPVSERFIRVVPSASGNYIIDHPLANGNPAAKIYVTHRFPTQMAGLKLDEYYNNADLLTVYNYKLAKWEIKNQNQSPLAKGVYHAFISTNDNNENRIGEIANTNNSNLAVINTPSSANAATSSGYSDPTLTTHLNARNDKATLQYLSTLSLEQRIKIQTQSATLMNTVYRRLLTQGTRSDMDTDGHSSKTVGGDDCDDFNPLINPSRRELCTKDSIVRIDGTAIVWMPSLIDEDCNPNTVVHVGPDTHVFAQEPSESDRDGDGIASCECFNYGLGALPVLKQTKDDIQKKWENIILIPLKRESSGADFLTHGTDCDDTNPAIGKNSQKCMGENKVAICIKGKWEVKDCRKCVTQPNGTGLVTEW